MRRLAFLVLLCASVFAAAQDQDFSKVQIKVTKVSGNIYMLEGAGGNIAASVGEAGIAIIAQDNVRKRLESGGKASNGGGVSMEQKPAAKGALPIITFDHDVTVHLNGEDIRALHFPARHTDGDAIVFFPKANVVHMGDDFVRYGYPF